VPRRLYSGFSFVALMLTLAAIVWADLHRGPWYDEFYTQFVTRPGVPWGQALRQSWLADNHPPLFYMLSRATDWLGAIPLHRLLNPALGLVAVAGAWVVLRDLPGMAPVAAGLALGLAACPWTLLAGSELRSYFLSLCAGTLLALCLCVIRMGGRSRGLVRVYAVSAMVAFNVHIVTSLTAGALILPFLLEAFVRRDRQSGRIIAIPALAGGLVFTATSLIQLPLWLANTQVFWIEPGFSSGRWAVEWAVLHTLSGNVLLVAGALAGVGLMLRDAARRQGSGEGSALLLLACGLGMAVVGLIAVHMVRPMLIEKYLTALVGGLCVLLALGFARLLRAAGLRWGVVVLLLALGVSGLSLWANTRQAIARPGWMGTGRMIAAMVARCPGGVVHTDPRWNANVVTALPRDNALVVPFAYRSVADDLGFSLAPAGSRTMAATCPTIFWGEHDGAHHYTRDIVLADLHAAGFPVTTLNFHRIDDGWVAVAPAP
jgi:hypothetical protein